MQTDWKRLEHLGSQIGDRQTRAVVLGILGAIAPTAFDLEAATVDELFHEAERLGLEVVRAEGEGEPLKADYQNAILASSGYIVASG